MLVPDCALNKHTSNLPFCLNFNFKHSVHLYILGKCKSRFVDPQNSVIVCLVSWCTDAASNPVGSRQMCNKDWKPPSHPPFQSRCTLYGEQVEVGTWKNQDLPKKTGVNISSSWMRWQCFSLQIVLRSKNLSTKILILQSCVLSGLCFKPNTFKHWRASKRSPDKRIPLFHNVNSETSYHML